MSEPAPAAPAARGDAMRTAFASSIGGPRGMIDSGLPSVAFVVAYLVAGLTVALWVAVGVGVALCAWRLSRRQSVQQAMSGFFGVAVAAFVAWKLGRAEGFFLPGIVINLVWGVVFLASVVLRRPLVGYVAALLDAGRDGKRDAGKRDAGKRVIDPEPGGAEPQALGWWRSDRDLLRAYSWATLVWVALFWIRVAVQAPYYLQGKTLELGIAKLALGWPLTAVGLAITVLLVRRSRGRSAVRAFRRQECPQSRLDVLGGDEQ